MVLLLGRASAYCPSMRTVKCLEYGSLFSLQRGISIASTWPHEVGFRSVRNHFTYRISVNLTADIACESVVKPGAQTNCCKLLRRSLQFPPEERESSIDRW